MPVATPGTSSGARRVGVMGSYYTDGLVTCSKRVHVHANGVTSGSSPLSLVAPRRVGDPAVDGWTRGISGAPHVV